MGSHSGIYQAGGSILPSLYTTPSIRYPLARFVILVQRGGDGEAVDDIVHGTDEHWSTS
jgi:hypothetical protein